MVINTYFESCLSLPNGYMKISRNGDYVCAQPYGLWLLKTGLVTTELLFNAKSAAIRDFSQSLWQYSHMNQPISWCRLTTLRTFHHGTDSTLSLIQDILSLDMHLLAFHVMFPPKLILMGLKNFLPTSPQISFLTMNLYNIHRRETVGKFWDNSIVLLCSHHPEASGRID